MNYSSSFLSAVFWLLGHEKGYGNNPADPGLATCWGISKKQYPGLAIEGLTLDAAVNIYYQDYWVRPHFDQLEPLVAAKVFDMGVQFGPGHAILDLQTACNLLVPAMQLKEDGVLGPRTFTAIASVSRPALLATLCGLMFERYRQNDNPTFRGGWYIRAMATPG